MNRYRIAIASLLFALSTSIAAAQPIDVEGQPLAGNARRVLKALESMGTPLGEDQAAAVLRAADMQDAAKLQELAARKA